jgi:hypothetical protein
MHRRQNPLNSTSCAFFPHIPPRSDTVEHLKSLETVMSFTEDYKV